MAVVLFFIVKAINATRALGGKLKRTETAEPKRPRRKFAPTAK